ncbi:hypothetical protein ATANTOWER_011046 [Ataeniobius toweri]|uniref:Uncharacterized protein n=1 Tax=Ataeniobius toweri TaxID=208326 RepID=A0ABU7BF10_9TELE|nr:hypothetical protein [Ataeniobius toweri]
MTKKDVEAESIATLIRASDGKRSPKKRLLLLLLNRSRLSRSGLLQSPKELQEPYADRAIKASDECGRESKTTCRGQSVVLVSFLFSI